MTSKIVGMEKAAGAALQDKYISFKSLTGAGVWIPCNVSSESTLCDQMKKQESVGQIALGVRTLHPHFYQEALICAFRGRSPYTVYNVLATHVSANGLNQRGIGSCVRSDWESGRTVIEMNMIVMSGVVPSCEHGKKISAETCHSADVGLYPAGTHARMSFTPPNVHVERVAAREPYL